MFMFVLLINFYIFCDLEEGEAGGVGGGQER